MPSTVTHAYFSMDLYDRLDKKKQKLLEPYKEQLKIFGQGPDVFFFYNLMNPGKGKKIRRLGYYMQKNETQAFFVNLVTTIKDKKLEKNPEILAFLYGLIAHYISDMTMHPFIIYKTGIFDRKDKSTYKYFGGHEQMESYIDAYFMQIRGKTKPKDFKAYKFCFQNTHISDTLKQLIDDVFEKTFNEKNVGNKYATSVKQMKSFFALYRHDPTGIKKKIYGLSQILPFNIKLDTISYHITLDKNDYYLNLNKEYWHHPLDKNEIYNYSFIELYAIALSKAIKLIDEVDKALLTKKNLRHLNEVFPNLSYATGYDCKLGRGIYFSF